MCDVPNCRTVFSENDEGWTTGTMARSVRDPQTRKRHTLNVTYDMCPQHAEAFESGAHMLNGTTPQDLGVSAYPEPSPDVTQPMNKLRSNSEYGKSYGD